MLRTHIRVANLCLHNLAHGERLQAMLHALIKYMREKNRTTDSDMYISFESRKPTIIDFPELKK